MTDEPAEISLADWQILNAALDAAPFGHHIKGDPDKGEWRCTCGYGATAEPACLSAEQHIAAVVFEGLGLTAWTG